MPEQTHLGLARTDEANLEHPNAMTDYPYRIIEANDRNNCILGYFGLAIVQVRGSSVPDPY